MIIVSKGSIECPYDKEVRLYIPTASLSGRPPIIHLNGGGGSGTTFTVSLELKLNGSDLDNTPIVLGSGININSTSGYFTYDLADYADYHNVDDCALLIHKDTDVLDDTINYEIVMEVD